MRNKKNLSNRFKNIFNPLSQLLTSSQQIWIHNFFAGCEGRPHLLIPPKFAPVDPLHLSLNCGSELYQKAESLAKELGVTDALHTLLILQVIGYRIWNYTNNTIISAHKLQILLNCIRFITWWILITNKLRILSTIVLSLEVIVIQTFQMIHGVTTNHTWYGKFRLYCKTLVHVHHCIQLLSHSELHQVWTQDMEVEHKQHICSCAAVNVALSQDSPLIFEKESTYSRMGVNGNMLQGTFSTTNNFISTTIPTITLRAHIRVMNTAVWKSLVEIVNWFQK